MNTLEIKTDLIQLVESTQNEKVLSVVLAFFKDLVTQNDTSFWQNLSDHEKDEILNAYLESEDDKELIPVDAAFEKLK